MSIETDKIKGTVLMLGSVFMYSAMACMIKIASEYTNAYVMSFIMVDETCIIWSCILSSKNGDGKILRDAPGYIRVLIFRC